MPGLIFIFFNSMQDEYVPLDILGPREISDNNDTIYHRIPDFELLSQTGKMVAHHDFDDCIYIADFFFTSCPSPEFCPRLSSSMNLIQRKFFTTPEVKLISFSVDPERDSVPVLAEYASKYFADQHKWFFLTGNRDTIYHLIQKGYLLSAIHGDIDPAAFIHTDKFVLIDKEKRIRGYYNGREEKEVTQLVKDINVLLFEYTRKKTKENKLEYKPQNNE